MSIFAGLPNPAAPAQAFFSGLERGKADKEEREVRGALSAYAVNPDDPAAFQTLAQWRPEIAMQIREDQTKRQQRQQVAELQQRAATGDRTALAQLAGIDLDAYDKLADNDRAATGERVDAIGQAALRISQLPPEQRPQAWDAAVGQLSQRWPELAQYQGQYSEDALLSAIDTAQQVGKFFELERPNYQAVPYESTLVNTRDPAAVQAFLGGGGAAPVQVSSPDEAAKLPPGTRFVDPNGVVRQVPGGAGGNAGGNFRP